MTKSRVYVMDSSSPIAYLRHEPGGVRVGAALKEHRSVMHALNVCEVYYDTVRVAGHSAAALTLNDLYTVLEVNEDMSLLFVRAAGDVKARGSIAIGDAFAVALAGRLNATVLTADRREFGPLAEAGLLNVEFIR